MRRPTLVRNFLSDQLILENASPDAVICTMAVIAPVHCTDIASTLDERFDRRAYSLRQFCG